MWLAPKTKQSSDSEYVYSLAGLFPAPVAPSQAVEPRVIKYFESLGKFVAKGLADGRLVRLIFFF